MANLRFRRAHFAVFFVALLFESFAHLEAQSASENEDIRLRPGDIYIQYDKNESGFHLWVRNKEAIGSILITDHTSDPDGKEPVYALRASSYNSTNGDEKRMLDGRFLPQELYSLIDSTPESNPYFPRGAFHIFIPFEVNYGYPWSRHGSINIGKGSWLNVRSFRKSYGDYSGGYQDNPFVLSMPELPETAVNPVAKPAPSPAPESLAASDAEPPLMDNVLSSLDQKIDDLAKNTIDIALVVDTTVSMRDHVSFLKRQLVPMVRAKVAKFDSFRVGVVLYRDYGEAYLVKSYDFTEDLEAVQNILNGITVAGGGDKEEAVDEGIYAALTDLHWKANKRLVIQVGDADAHAIAKGTVTPAMLQRKSQELLVDIQQIKLEDRSTVHTTQDLKAERQRRLALAGPKDKLKQSPDEGIKVIGSDDEF